MINQPNLKKSTTLIRAIAHPIRLAIIKHIATSGTTNVNKIYSTLKLEQSITSQHLRVLRAAELVKTSRDGKYINYSVNTSKLSKVNNILKDFFSKSISTTEEDTEGTFS